MNYFFFLLLFTLQICNRLPFVIGKKNDEKCPFHETVNLTNHEFYENGSYIYQGIIIPPAKQQIYEHNIKFLGAKEMARPHLRGCVCGKKPCIKLCCAEDEFLNATKTTSQCEKLTKNMNVSWNVPLSQEKGYNETKNIFQHFIYQIGFPCDHPQAMLKEDRAILFDNGSLYAQTDNSLLTTRDYCYSPHFDNKTEHILLPFSCPMSTEASWTLLLNTYGMTISVLFLIPTIVIYVVLKELRRNISGKLLICYLSSLTIGYAIISFINISQLRFDFITCSLLGFTCYFFFMAAFLWLSVLCFDLWINFNETNIEIDNRKNCKHFIVYSLYAWLNAALATGCLIYLEGSDIDELYKPGIGGKICWLDTDKWSALYYFYGPELLILIFNSATFIHLTIKVYTVKRDLARITQRERFLKENGVVILRLFLIMGVSWLFDILSYCLREYETWEFVFILSDFANAVQGIAIFILFTMKSNVIKLLKKRFHIRQKNKSGRSDSCSTKCFYKMPSLTAVPTADTP